MKKINKYITEKLKITKYKKSEYTLFPETNYELQNMIKKEIKDNGIHCSLNHIDVSEVKDMSFLFSGSLGYYSKFNGDISEWNVSNVKNMHGMFYGSDFNGDILNWDVSNVMSMGEMFRGSKFNQDINDWNTSNVVDMEHMFRDSSFNQPLNNWDVSNVKYMASIFKDSIFNQDISMWKINPKCIINNMFYGCNIEEKYKPKCLKK